MSESGNTVDAAQIEDAARVMSEAWSLSAQQIAAGWDDFTAALRSTSWTAAELGWASPIQ